jgi:hypothetical protein
MSGDGSAGPVHKEGDNLWSGGAQEGETRSVGALSDLFYRSEGIAEGGVPQPRRRRHKEDAGDVAGLFGTGSVDGGVDAVFEGGIIGAGMDATNAMITSATMAQADQAMRGLAETRQIAKARGEELFMVECEERLERKYEGVCERNRLRPDGRRAASVQECVAHWMEDRGPTSVTSATQTQHARTDGTGKTKGGKTSGQFKVGGGEIVKGEFQGGTEDNWSDAENHQSTGTQGTSGSVTFGNIPRASRIPQCEDEANARYRNLFPF